MSEGDPSSLAEQAATPDQVGELQTPIPADDRQLDPQKLLRVASLAREVLEELRRLSPADSNNDQLAQVYKQVKEQLYKALPNELVEELDSISLDMPFADGVTHEEARIAYSALIGWISGLFQGLQAATLQAQAMMEISRQGQGQPPSKPVDKEGYL